MIDINAFWNNFSGAASKSGFHVNNFFASLSSILSSGFHPPDSDLMHIGKIFSIISRQVSMAIWANTPTSPFAHHTIHYKKSTHLLAY